MNHVMESVAVLITAGAIHVAAGAQRSSWAAKYLAGNPQMGIVLTPGLTRRLRVEIWLLATIAIAVLVIQPLASGLAITLPLLGVAAVAILRWRQLLETARNQEIAKTPIRKAVLFVGDKPGPGATATAIPFVLLAAVAIYLSLQWNELPRRWATHWGASGEANGFSSKSFFGVYGILLLGAGVLAGIYAIQRGIQKDARRNLSEATPQLQKSWRLGLRGTAAAMYVIAALFGGVALIPTFAGQSFLGALPWALPALIVGVIVFTLWPQARQRGDS